MEKFTIRDSIRFLGKYIRPYGKHFAAFYGGWLFETILSVLLPKLLGIMLDQIVYGGDLKEFMLVSGAAAIFSVYSCVLYYWLYAQHHYLMIMFTFQIKLAVFEKFMTMQPVKLKTFTTGEITAVIQDYPAECMHFFIRGVIHQINNFVIIAAVLLFTFRISPAAGVTMAVLSALCGGTAVFFGNQTGRASVRLREEYGKYIGWLCEILENSTAVRLLNAAQKTEEKFRVYSKNMFREKNRMEHTKVLSEQLNNAVFLLSRLCIFGLAVYLTGTGMLTIGTFTVIIAYFGRLTDTLADINAKWNDAQTRAGYIRKIRDFLDCPDEEDQGKAVPENCRGDICTENLSFSYGEHVICRQFNLHIRPGEKAAVVGPSGIGKSTLAELLAGLLTPDQGCVKLDGIPITEYTRKSLRRKLGILFQEPLAVEESLRGNLLLAKRDASEEEMWKALRDAGLQEFASALAGGLDARIRDTLSGGQRQRLGIAQLCLRDPDIVILDEPTSALDEETEQEILARWEETFREKTMVIITHRKGPLAICGRVIRMEELIGKPMEKPIEKQGGNPR